MTLAIERNSLACTHNDNHFQFRSTHHKANSFIQKMIPVCIHIRKKNKLLLCVKIDKTRLSNETHYNNNQFQNKTNWLSLINAVPCKGNYTH